VSGAERPPLRFGIFDHLERRADVPLDRLYDERLDLLARADALGFWGYHLAEHHNSPLCMAPAPSLFLAAAARATRAIRLGTLVYQLPLHHPLRLLEEICMLDHLTGGRLQVGVGRGITAIEHTWWGMSPEEAEARYRETLAVLVAGLTGDELRHDGRFFRFDGVPLDVAPKQRPYPPFWYAGNAEGAAAGGMHFVGRGGARLPETVTRYRQVWERERGRPDRVNPGVTDPVVGGSVHMVVADTDEEAERLARASWPVFQGNFAKRGLGGPGPETRPDGTTAPVPPGGPATELGRDVDRALRAGALVAGSPDTVRALVERYPGETGANYFVASFQWGSITHEQALRSLELFGTEVIARMTPAPPR
jgi:alkanesulfonate monooxygenase SsuD/methylene tetrahydromethanopterin reductase-like flavin-dependent oxidoreductase (luciferase family)